MEKEGEDLFMILNREEAISKAEIANRRLILITGKGSEQKMFTGGKMIIGMTEG